MKRVTSSVLMAAASGAMIVGCATSTPERGYANRNGPGQIVCPVPSIAAGPNGACCGVNGACAVPEGPATPVNQATADALRATLEDELTAQAFYDAILTKHGDVRPFTNIVRAEARHAEAVRAIMQRHQVDDSGVVARPLPEIPATVAECAQLAAQLERDNIALYDRFILIASDADVKATFEQLRAASLNNHLPAFERMAGL